MKKEEAKHYLEVLKESGVIMQPEIRDSINYALKYINKKEIKETKQTQTDNWITCPANVSALIKVDAEAEIPFALLEVNYEKSEDGNYKILQELNGERIFIYRDGKAWSIISKEYYDHAITIMKAWFSLGAKSKLIPKFLISKEKDMPVVVYEGNMGLLIAPRIEADEE